MMMIIKVKRYLLKTHRKNRKRDGKNLSQAKEKKNQFKD